MSSFPHGQAFSRVPAAAEASAAAASPQMQAVAAAEPATPPCPPQTPSYVPFQGGSRRGLRSRRSQERLGVDLSAVHAAARPRPPSSLLAEEASAVDGAALRGDAGGQLW